ncbi:hypothetical protein [Zobellella sp. DQSA1]|uniref:hypothetical protein n=1 Tax=Zobellella sp. DQSA1 TaxID=3342386 RepID=UPI0035BF36CD
MRKMALMLYLSCAYFIALFLMSIIFQALGYWIGGGESIIGFIKENMWTYFKMGIIGFFVGFALWLFNVC